MSLISPTKFWNRATTISDDASFNTSALELFRYQARQVTVYAEYLKLIKHDPASVKHISEIPFLPVTLFKNNVISDQEATPEYYFSSSGTSGQLNSRHYVADIEIYHKSLLAGFEYFYGNPKQYRFLFLLPSYLEREGSSLVYMADRLIKKSENKEGGFFLHNHDALAESISKGIQHGNKIFLLGVSYALIDFFEKYPMNLSNTIIMETGGMKGQRKELIKGEVHGILAEKSGVKKIHSEYGMTELLSQAYSKGDGIFECPPWMKILTGDIHDPFNDVGSGETGIIKVIDLANIHSCAFIETRDLGRKYENGHFEILGRMDHSELRGCNLMVG